MLVYQCMSVFASVLAPGLRFCNCSLAPSKATVGKLTLQSLSSTQ